MISYQRLLSKYEHEPRYVTPLKLVATPKLAFKAYMMLKYDSFLTQKEMSTTEQFLKSEIESGKITPQIGIGFSILSEDMLNVARWDATYPIVLKNDIYIYERNDIQTAKLADVRKTGSFCIWELGIVSHERDAWKRFLASKHTREDKKRYLDDFFDGAL